MVRVVEYYSQFQGVRSRVTGLPSWARSLLFLASLPGVVLIALSFLAFLVSLLALLLLTVPLYRLLKLVTGTGGERPVGETGTVVTDFASPGRKRVEATVTDAPVTGATVTDAPAAGQGL
jgi:membrane protein implicated in regulation of membrane protease activity